MVWNTNDWTTEEEDKHWEMTEEDTDDEFDDIALSRLGIDLPACAREERISMPERPESHLDMGAVLARWQASIEADPDNRTTAHQELMNALAEVQPTEPLGVDPERAGFEWTDELCEDCNQTLIECVCDDLYCQGCGEPLEDGCDCEY